MVIPEAHVEFLKLPLSFWLATSSLDNIPEPIKCTGIRFDPGSDVLTCFVPMKYALKGLEHVAENSLVSLVAVELHTYEGYQYKGQYFSHRECTPEEVAFQRTYMAELTSILESFGYSGAGFFSAYFLPPFVAITFQVREVFDQSPKPGTGGQIKGLPS
jgi:hypothetical protein